MSDDSAELIAEWWQLVIRMRNKDYANNGEFWAMLGRMMELQADLKAMGYTCLDGQWIQSAEAN